MLKQCKMVHSIPLFSFHCDYDAINSTKKGCTSCKIVNVFILVFVFLHSDSFWAKYNKKRQQNDKIVQANPDI